MTAKRLYMTEQWDEFARKCLPRNATGEQRKQLRRAFYAGGYSLLFSVVQGFAPEHEPTEADLALMQGVYEELTEFFEKHVKAGRA